MWSADTKAGPQGAAELRSGTKLPCNTASVHNISSVGIAGMSPVVFSHSLKSHHQLSSKISITEAPLKDAQCMLSLGRGKVYLIHGILTLAIQLN